MKSRAFTLLVMLVFLIPTTNNIAQDNEITLTFVAFSVPREAYSELIPIFAEQWEAETGQKVIFNETFQASGSQSQAVIGGLEADIVALSLEADVTAIAEAGLITHDWQQRNHGTITSSVVVLAVQPGNPKNIEDWDDIARNGIEVITPDPITSGGAQWNLLAAYGAARRGYVEGYEASDEDATEFLSKVIENVLVLVDARESFLLFENGVGDVAITYENEIFAARRAGSQVDIIYPRSTILIENPIAVVDVYVDKHETREVAEAFVDFLYTPEAQRIFAIHGFRPVDEEVAAKFADLFPVIEDLFTIEEFGGWTTVREELFGENGRFIQLFIEVKSK